LTKDGFASILLLNKLDALLEVYRVIAIEFETESKAGMIKIPEEYQKMMGGKVKIIMLKEAENVDSRKKDQISNIKQCLREIREKNIFAHIKNPVEWQRNLRDEWQ
jgi:hypothetical protein